jgi:hypothetical protein
MFGSCMHLALLALNINSFAELHAVTYQHMWSAPLGQKRTHVKISATTCSARTTKRKLYRAWRERFARSKLIARAIGRGKGKSGGFAPRNPKTKLGIRACRHLRRENHGGKHCWHQPVADSNHAR